MNRNLHRGDRGDRARVSREGGEGNGGASLLNIIVAQTSRKMGLTGDRLGDRDDVRAVDHLGNILADDGELSHGSLESVLELGLVVC